MTSSPAAAHGRLSGATLALGKVLLLLGLLLVHVVGGDHVPATHAAHTQAATHSSPADAHRHGTAASEAAAPASFSASSAPASDSLAADGHDAGSCVGEGCGLTMAMAGLCLIALLAGGLILRRVYRNASPLVRRGPPPVRLWRPIPAVRTGPSLVRLSISRT